RQNGGQGRDDDRRRLRYCPFVGATPLSRRAIAPSNRRSQRTRRESRIVMRGIVLLFGSGMDATSRSVLAADSSELLQSIESAQQSVEVGVISWGPTPEIMVAGTLVAVDAEDHGVLDKIFGLVGAFALRRRFD